MKIAALVLATAAVLAGLVFAVDSGSSPPSAGAAFHLMRVHGVMAGAGGSAEIQYVELRMASGGQTFVGGQDICFFDQSGDPWARFTFPSSVSNGAQSSSILVGSVAMDLAWGPAPDFLFAPGNTTPLAGDASTTAPVPAGSGKVAFGSDSATLPSAMCRAMFSLIDSVAYGPAYSGAVDFGSKVPSDLDIAATNGLKLTGPLCAPGGCVPERDNAADYTKVNVNDDGNNPRNNAGQSGPITTDGATPTPTPSGSPTQTPVNGVTPTPTAPPGEQLQGDVNCDGAVTSVDSLGILRDVADLPQLAQQEPCTDIGEEHAGDGVQGDINCDGAVTSVDSLGVLRHVAVLPPISQNEPCPDIGTPV